MIRTPDQVLSLTPRLSFRDGKSPCSDRAQSPVLSTPEIMRHHRAFKENSHCFDMSSDISISVSPPRTNDSFAAVKRNIDSHNDEEFNCKIPRTGLSEIFHFANLNDDSDLRPGCSTARNFSPPGGRINSTPISQVGRVRIAPNTCTVPCQSPMPYRCDEAKTPFRTSRLTKRAKQRRGVVFSSPAFMERNSGDESNYDSQNNGCVLGTPVIILLEAQVSLEHASTIEVNNG